MPYWAGKITVAEGEAIGVEGKHGQDGRATVNALPYGRASVVVWGWGDWRVVRRGG